MVYRNNSRYRSRDRDHPRHSRDSRRNHHLRRDSHPYARRRRGESGRHRTSSPSFSTRYRRNSRSRSPRRFHKDIARYEGPRPRHDNWRSRRSRTPSPPPQPRHESPGSLISLGSPMGRSTPVYHSEAQSSPREPKAGQLIHQSLSVI